MSDTYFLDTSALLKLYHQEAGTEQIEALFQQQENTLVISELAIVEFYSSLFRKVRTREITIQAQEEAHKNFEEDCAQRFVIEPLENTVIQTAKELLRKHGNQHALRALDALQLSTCHSARVRGELTFVCADARLVGIAQREGLPIINPETT